MSSLLAALVLASGLSPAHASSHAEAPAIALDPAADLTDFYAFVHPDDPSKAVFILNVNPLENPGGGPNFHRFDDTVTYMINIDNEGDGVEDIRYSFRFDTSYLYPETFLYNVGPIPGGLNQVQTYDVGRWEDGAFTRLTSPSQGCTAAPAHVGVLSNPAGSYTPRSSTPGTLTADHICNVDSDIRVFAGPRQEGFFVDLERTFDLLNLDNPDNLNTLLGYNVHSIAIEVPIEDLTRDGQTPDVSRGNQVIAAWATTARRRTRVLQGDGTSRDSGPLTQIARLGSPLVNEVVIGVGDKDRFNASHPSGDAQFLDYVLDPLLPVYMEALLGVPNPISTGLCDQGLGFGGREDLVLAFLTGHPALGTMPSNYALGGPIDGEPGKVFGAFEALRLDLSNPVSSFPNGRAPADDVVDVALSAMGGLLCDGVTSIPDGVDATGLSFLTSFPFLGDPWAGDDHPAAFHELP